MNNEQFIKVLPDGDSALENSAQGKKVALKMIGDANADINTLGLALQGAATDTGDKITVKDTAEKTFNAAVKSVGDSVDVLKTSYKVSIAKITEIHPNSPIIWEEDYAVDLSKEGTHAPVCGAPQNGHASHGDMPHTVDAVCNSDKNRTYMAAFITFTPLDETSLIATDPASTTKKQITFTVPVAFRNLTFWVILVPFNTNGPGTPSAPIKCDPIS